MFLNQFLQRLRREMNSIRLVLQLDVSFLILDSRRFLLSFFHDVSNTHSLLT